MTFGNKTNKQLNKQTKQNKTKQIKKQKQNNNNNNNNNKTKQNKTKKPENNNFRTKLNDRTYELTSTCISELKPFGENTFQNYPLEEITRRSIDLSPYCRVTCTITSLSEVLRSFSHYYYYYQKGHWTSTTSSKLEIFIPLLVLA